MQSVLQSTRMSMHDRFSACVVVCLQCVLHCAVQCLMQCVLQCVLQNVDAHVNATSIFMPMHQKCQVSSGKEFDFSRGLFQRDLTIFACTVYACTMYECCAPTSLVFLSVGAFLVLSHT